MKFAQVDGNRITPQPTLKGRCPVCGSEVVARCGEIRVWHWAHRGKRTCDSWWENETEWHRAWKDRFPLEWQEIIHFAEDGEKHIADVKTSQGIVIEFQHSRLERTERQAREKFYRKMLWVVDGLRRKTDPKRFLEVWNHGKVVQNNSAIRLVPQNACRLLSEWSNCSVPVFFDFGTHVLWFLVPGSKGGLVTICTVRTAEIVKLLNDGAYNFWPEALDISGRKPPQSPRLGGFEDYFRRRYRARSRFRL